MRANRISFTIASVSCWTLWLARASSSSELMSCLMWRQGRDETGIGVFAQPTRFPIGDPRHFVRRNCPGIFPARPCDTGSWRDLSFVPTRSATVRGTPKIAIAFAGSSLPDTFAVIDADSGASVFAGKPQPLPRERWAAFEHLAELDFTGFSRPGRYMLQLGEARSLPFVIGDESAAKLPDQLLEFMRQQRCGYNPWLGVKCHQHDGRTAYGPLPAGTPIDAVGGWHDAGDMLKYHMTSGNATAQMLLAHAIFARDAPKGSAFPDRVDARGDIGPERASRHSRRSSLGPRLDAQAPPCTRPALSPGGRRPRSCRLPLAAK